MNAKRLLFSLIAVLAVSWAGMAQQQIPWQENPNYGETPEEREKTAILLNYFRDAYDVKNFDLAVQYMNQLIDSYPRTSRNIYIRGGNIYKSKIALAGSMAERNVFIDSLMYIYDKRIEAFGEYPDSRDKGALYTSKAVDYLAYRPADHEKVHQYFKEAIDATEGKDDDLLKRYFATLTNDFKADLVDTDNYISEYERIGELMANAPNSEEGQTALDELFSQTDAADCEILERINRPKYEASPNDVELMKKIMNMMLRAKCSNDFLLEVAENLYKVEKSPETGIYLATLFESRQDFEKSQYYWEESLNNEPDPGKKADYMMRAAASALSSSNYRQAVSFARSVLNIDPNNGLAYMIIGQSYGLSVGSSCSDSFEKFAAYWIVVDNLQKARSLLSGDQHQVEALTKQINQYSTQFPNSEECFFRSLKNGDSYTVNCGWISGRTTVRERN